MALRSITPATDNENIGILTDRSRSFRNDPAWEQNPDVRLSPESIARVCLSLSIFTVSLFNICLSIYSLTCISQTKIDPLGPGSLTVGFDCSSL